MKKTIKVNSLSKYFSYFFILILESAILTISAIELSVPIPKFNVNLDIVFLIVGSALLILPLVLLVLTYKSESKKLTAEFKKANNEDDLSLSEIKKNARILFNNNALSLIILVLVSSLFSLLSSFLVNNFIYGFGIYFTYIISLTLTFVLIYYSFKFLKMFDSCPGVRVLHLINYLLLIFACLLNLLLALFSLFSFFNNDLTLSVVTNITYLSFIVSPVMMICFVFFKFETIKFKENKDKSKFVIGLLYIVFSFLFVAYTNIINFVNFDNEVAVYLMLGLMLIGFSLFLILANGESSLKDIKYVKILTYLSYACLILGVCITLLSDIYYDNLIYLLTGSFVLIGPVVKNLKNLIEVNRENSASSESSVVSSDIKVCSIFNFVILGVTLFSYLFDYIYNAYNHESVNLNLVSGINLILYIVFTSIPLIITSKYVYKTDCDLN